MAKRLNPGRSSDLPLLFDAIEYNNPESSSVEFWTVYDRGNKNGFRRWKLAASVGTSVLGTANYTINVRDNQLYTNDDGSKLRAERNGLFIIIAGLAAGNLVPTDMITSDTEDEFGDIALNRGGKLMQVQQWNRALLNMRVYELHWECRPDRDSLPPGVKRAPSWEQGVRQAWFGIYRDNFEACIEAHKKSIAADARLLGHLNVDTGVTTPDWNAAIMKLTRHLTKDMPQEMIDDAIAFIKNRGEGDIDFEAYSQIIKAFHAGEFKPTPYATLAAQLNMIAGIDSLPISVDGTPLDDLLS